MKQPEAGELWLDEKAWAVTGNPRLLLVDEVRDDGTVAARAMEGGAPGPEGVPLHYFNEVMSWQGYWSTEKKVLPRLSPPYTGHPLEQILKAGNAKRLQASATLVNSIIPSFSPSNIQTYNREGHYAGTADLHQTASSIPAGISFLQFQYRKALIGHLPTPEQIVELWYQRQQSAWWLVRTLVVRKARARFVP